MRAALAVRENYVVVSGMARMELAHGVSGGFGGSALLRVYLDEHGQWVRRCVLLTRTGDQGAALAPSGKIANDCR